MSFICVGGFSTTYFKLENEDAETFIYYVLIY